MLDLKFHARSLRGAVFAAAALGLPGSIGCTPDENELESDTEAASDEGSTESSGSPGSASEEASTGSTGEIPDPTDGETTSSSGASTDSSTSANTSESTTGLDEDTETTTGGGESTTGDTDGTTGELTEGSDSGTTGTSQGTDDGVETSPESGTSTGDSGLGGETGSSGQGEAEATTGGEATTGDDDATAGETTGGEATGGETTGGEATGGETTGGETTDDGQETDEDETSDGEEDTGGGEGPPDDGLIVELSDEFDDPGTFPEWLLRDQVEGTPAQYSVLDIDTSTPGMLTWLPTTSGWYADFVGPFMFKFVEGDFMIETYVIARNRNDPNAGPSQLYNSAGLMVRDPNSVPGQQNWVAHNVGRQDIATGIATENKTTFNSASQLFLFPGTYRGILRICRVGNVFVMTRRLDGEAAFVETRRFTRTFPDEVQVGLVASGWNSNGSTPNFNLTPDVQAEFEYVRFYEIDADTRCLEE